MLSAIIFTFALAAIVTAAVNKGYIQGAAPVATIATTAIGLVFFPGLLASFGGWLVIAIAWLAAYRMTQYFLQSDIEWRVVSVSTQLIGAAV